MNKEVFTALVDELKTFYHELYPQYEKLGLMPETSPILERFDHMLEAVNADLDPANIGENLLTHDTPLLYAYIFEYKPSTVKSSGDFYDYVKALYEKHAEEIAKIKPYLLIRH